MGKSPPKAHLFIITLFLSVVLFAQHIETLAVLDFDGFGINEFEAKTLTDRLRNYVVQIGTYQLIERGAMEEILKEQGLQQSGCSSNECIVEVGQLLGVKYMLGGTIGKVGNTFTISMRIIDVETAAILKTANYDMTGAIDELLKTGLREAAEIILGGEKREPASLAIRTIPAGADIFIGNELKGQSPLRLSDLPAGKEITIEAILQHFEPASRNMTLAPGSNDPLNLELVRETGTVTVAGTPEGSVVKINSEMVGTTPLEAYPYPTGPQNVLISKPGYVRFSQPIDIKAREDIQINYSLQKKSKPLAITMSAVVPGSGQLYQGYTRRGLVFFVSGIAAGYLTFDAYQSFRESKDTYITKTNLYNTTTDETLWAARKADAEAAHSTMIANEKTFLTWSGLLGGVWVINLLEVTF